MALIEKQIGENTWFLELQACRQVHYEKKDFDIEIFQIIQSSLQNDPAVERYCICIQSTLVAFDIGTSLLTKQGSLYLPLTKPHYINHFRNILFLDNIDLHYHREPPKIDRDTKLTEELIQDMMMDDHREKPERKDDIFISIGEVGEEVERWVFVNNNWSSCTTSIEHLVQQAHNREISINLN